MVSDKVCSPPSHLVSPSILLFSFFSFFLFPPSSLLLSHCHFSSPNRTITPEFDLFFFFLVLSFLFPRPSYTRSCRAPQLDYLQEPRPLAQLNPPSHHPYLPSVQLFPPFPQSAPLSTQYGKAASHRDLVLGFATQLIHPLLFFPFPFLRHSRKRYILFGPNLKDKPSFRESTPIIDTPPHLPTSLPWPRYNETAE